MRISDWSSDVCSSDLATYSRGFKSGGFSQRIAFPRTQAPAFDPEIVTNYEAGLKLQTADRRLRLYLAAFQLDYSNLQVVIFNRIEPQTQNGGQATIRGFEAEFQTTPVDGLNLSLDRKSTRLNSSH